MKQKLLLLVAVLCSAFSVQAATITYQLTTHVDGRTLTGTATVDEGASLQANMPQNLWRGYTTYKYYSDQALTQEITTAPAEDATVYVDYVFDPPFLMSNDNKTVWNYMRNYVAGGTTQRIVYYERGNILTERSTLANKDKYEQHWAFYGDGYDFKVKSRLTNVGNPWLVWTNNGGVHLDAEPSVGWQLYANGATATNRPGGTVALGRPDNKDLIYMPDLGIALKTQSINTSKHKFDSHNQLVAVHSGSSSQATMERDELWLYAFFASPTSLVPGTQDIWHVTYKIQKEDGTWYDDIVVQKRSDNLTPTWPVAGFEPAEGCKYDYFYTDATFTEKFEGAMPNNSNTTLYIKEKTIEYLTNAPWKTLVIPFSIDNLPEYFGADYEGVPAVDVLEFQEIQDGVITKVGEEDFYSCKLVFNPVDKIEAYKPYFFRVNRADEDAVNELYAAEGEAPCDVTTVNDEANPGISISMEGTLEPNGVYMDAEDGLHFFFGYNEQNEPNFYRASTTIPKNRCRFYVNDNRGYAKKLNVTFDMDGVTGIGQVMANTNTANDKVYNLNGQQVAGKLQKGIYIVNGKKVLVK